MADPSEHERNSEETGSETTLFSGDAERIREVLDEADSLKKRTIESEKEASEIIHQHGGLDIYYEGKPEGEIFAASGDPDIESVAPPSKLSEDPHSSTTMPEPESDMTRDELKAHLKANQAEVKRMTEEVGSKIDHLDDQIETRIGDLRTHLGSRIKSNRNWIIAFALIMVSLIGYGYSQIQTINDRLFQNAKRIEQVNQQSGPPTGIDSDTTQTSNQEKAGNN